MIQQYFALYIKWKCNRKTLTQAYRNFRWIVTVVSFTLGIIQLGKKRVTFNKNASWFQSYVPFLPNSQYRNVLIYKSNNRLACQRWTYFLEAQEVMLSTGIQAYRYIHSILTPRSWNGTQGTRWVRTKFLKSHRNLTKFLF